MKATKEKLVNAFKLVGPKGYGTNVTGAMAEYSMKNIQEILKRYPELYPRYTRRAVVKAAKGSVGILCFEKTEDAQAFRSKYPMLEKAHIVRVKGVKLKRVDWLWANCMNLLTLPNVKGKPYDICSFTVCSAPQGTIGFRWVKVGNKVIEGDLR